MIFVDSSVWIQFFNRHSAPTSGRRRLRELIEDDADIVVGDLVHLEVLRGFRRDDHLAQAKAALDAFDQVAVLDRDVALRAVEIYRGLRGMGITIRKTADLIIAAFCLSRGAWLLHDDRDFDPIGTHYGLKVLN